MGVLSATAEWGGNTIENYYEGLIYYPLIDESVNLTKNVLKTLHKSFVLAPYEVGKGIVEAVRKPEALKTMTLDAAGELVGGLWGIVTSTRDSLETALTGLGGILFEKWEQHPESLIDNVGACLKKFGWEAPKTLIKGILWDNLMKRSLAETGFKFVKGATNTLWDVGKGTKEAIVDLLKGQQNFWEGGVLGTLSRLTFAAAQTLAAPLGKYGKLNPQIAGLEKEKNEKLTELKLNCAEKCSNEGDYIGLSAEQRLRIGLNIGDVVELFDENNNFVGIYTVGKGKKSVYQSNPDSFTANVPDRFFNKIIKIKKLQKLDSLFEFNLSCGIESDVKHANRSQKIEQRFNNLNKEEYIRVPTSIGKLMRLSATTNDPNLLQISKGKVVSKDGQDHEMAIVPGGSQIGLTSQAATTLGVSSQEQTIKIKVKNGKLLII